MSFLYDVQRRPRSTAEPSMTALPSSTQSRLRSTQILTSFPQLVSELVQNSLDANAHNVEISLNAAEWECCVRDDGVGISKEGLRVISGGSDRGRYGTSKTYTSASLDEVTTFGFRGEALASAADISCLEVSSRTKHAREAWSVILKGSEALYAGPALRWRRESPGTVVSVRDAFYNLPIRRRSHPNPVRTVELVKKDVQSFALMFPGVSFALENISLANGGAHERSKTRILSVPKTNSTLATFRHMYGKALAVHVAELDEQNGDMRLEGFISLHGAHSKAYQYLFINKHHVAVCGIHKDIESVFAASTFSKHAYDEMGKMTSPKSNNRRSPRKTEKKPVYVLNITIPPRFVDNCFEPAKAVIQLQNSTAAAAFLTSVIRRVLAEHGFLNVYSEQYRQLGSAASPRKKRKLDQHCQHPVHPHDYPRFSGSAQTERGRNAPYATAAEAIPRNLPSIQEGAYPDTSHVVWKDPATGERFIIDSRTGNSYPELAPLVIEAEGSSAVTTSRARKTLHAGASSSAPRSSGIPAWIAEALTENDAYRLAERRITTLPTSSEAAGLSGDHAHHPRGASRGHAGTAWDASRIGRFTSAGLGAARVLGQVDRKFIACVMRTSTQGSTETSTEASTEASTSEVEDAGAVRDAPCPDCGPGSRQREGTLVLIDQHAADERVRVERFLRELCEGFLMSFSRPAGLESDEAGVRTRTLVPPVNVLLTGLEAKTLEQSLEIRTAFARWGVVFAKSPGIPRDYAIHSQEDESYSQIAVEAVPEVIADKLLAGGELRELVKGHLAKLEKDGLDGVPLNFGPAGDDTEAHAHGWQRALRYCPRGLIDLANSKACRGAIMFNDALTLEQCRTLLDGLAETALPFQCAHGRPSLVPLVEIRGEATGITRAEVDWTAFMGRSTA